MLQIGEYNHRKVNRDRKIIGGFMAEKDREKKCNKEKYLKKKRTKKKLDAIRRDRKISRDKRNQIRHAVEPTFSAFRNFIDKHLLFVVKDTENMERVLLQKVDIGNGQTLLTLPVINTEMVDRYFEILECLDQGKENALVSDNYYIYDLINFYYSVKADNIIRMDKANIFIFKDCEVGENTNLVALNVRPYNLNTWYDNEFTTLGAVKIYKGKKLKTFFKLDDEIECSKTYILNDTVVELLVYKAIMQKINGSDLLADIHALSQKQFLSTGELYKVVFTDFSILKRRFKNEENENEELNKVKQLRK